MAVFILWLLVVLSMNMGIGIVAICLIAGAIIGILSAILDLL